MKNNKLLIITGPTATGKTSLGLELAKKLNGEILSADSRQVYKFMDIGTGKDVDNFEWGLDLVEPGEDFSVSNWVKYAQKTLEDIWKRNKLPIIVGGTGQYIKELLNPSQTLHIPPNEKLRERLNKLSVLDLQNELQKIDSKKWEQMNNSDRNNPRRLVRAIETVGKIATVTSLPRNDMEVMIIGLTAPYEFLYNRIDKRVEERLMMGMEGEREKLSKYRLPNTIGYNNETAQEWKLKEHAYAKRQMIYLKNQIKDIVWFDISRNNDILGFVTAWYIEGNDKKG